MDRSCFEWGKRSQTGDRVYGINLNIYLILSSIAYLSLIGCFSGVVLVAAQTATPPCSLTPTDDAAYLFLTSNQYQANFGGLSGADAICAAECANAGLIPRGSGRMCIALLSVYQSADGTVNAIDRLPDGVAFFNTRTAGDGGPQCLAQDRTNLFSDLDLQNLILHPDGTTNTFSRAWTGTDRSGHALMPDCQDWTSNSNSDVGANGHPTMPGNGIWIWGSGQQSYQDRMCNNAFPIYCVDLPPSGSVSGDPQFIGFQGQRFQFHGFPDEYFNLISSPQWQLNSHFIYLANGKSDYNETTHWSHPGTYIDELGFQIGKDRIAITAGTRQHGLHLTINGQSISYVAGQPTTYNFPSNSNLNTHDPTLVNNNHTQHSDIDTTLFYFHSNRLIVESGMFLIVCVNADGFFNLEVQLRDATLLSAGQRFVQVTNPETASVMLSTAYPQVPIHGLIGQTWRNVKYKYGDSEQLWEGRTDDYLIESHNLFGTGYRFNYFYAQSLPIRMD
jgi:hypothetical protein